MKDVIVLSFEYSDHWRRKLSGPADKSIYEYPEIGKTLLPYLNSGYRITHFTAAGSLFFVLEKD